MSDDEGVKLEPRAGPSGYEEEYRTKIVTSIKQAFLYHPAYKVDLVFQCSVAGLLV